MTSIRKYYAHYDKETNEKQLLIDHLGETAEQCLSSINFQAVDFSIISRDEFKDCIYKLGLFHDIGKYSDFFQDYLMYDKTSNYKSHSLISSYILYNFLFNETHIEKYQKGDAETNELFILNHLSYYITKKHHGNLDTLNCEDISYLETPMIKKQYANLFKKKEEIISEIKKYVSEKKGLIAFDITFLKKNKLFNQPPNIIKNRLKNDEWYFYIILAFSSLISSDKLNSAGLKSEKIKDYSPDVVSEYINTKKRLKGGNIKLDDDREKVRKSVLKKIEDLDPETFKNGRIFFLTAPTGIGKTLTSIQAALLIAKRIKEIDKYNPRIITSIPFINIIEQTKSDYINLFEEKNVLIHHSMSFKSDNNSEEIDDKSKDYLKLDSWESSVIITTFVQFFHSIFTGKNKLLKKIHTLSGGIVILDEIQSIPEKYLTLIGWTINKISKYYGTRFILMTATKPKIIEFANLKLNENEKMKSIELLENNSEYFQKLNRTKIIPILDNKTNEDELINLIESIWDKTKSLLIVVNTIGRSIALYKRIKKYIDSVDEEIELSYLSTNIIPLERKKVIKEAKEKLEQNIPFIMISTQTIEAGVDLDFDMGIRDLSPLESIIQTAGRINREGKKEKHCPLYVIQLENDSNRVYKLHNLFYTKKVLSKTVEEEKYQELLEVYYNKILEQGLSDESNNLIEDGIMKLDFEYIEKNFHLIDNIQNIQDVFVEINDDATELANKYEEKIRVLAKLKGIEKYKTKIELKEITKKLSQYVISVRENKINKNHPLYFSQRNGIEGQFLWIPRDQLEEYYDEKTGFIDETGGSFVF